MVLVKRGFKRLAQGREEERFLGTKHRSQEAPDIPIPEGPIVGGIFFIIIDGDAQVVQAGVDHLVEQVEVILPPTAHEEAG